MVGTTAIFAFLGIGLGLIAGFWWGFSQSWLLGITASAGGAFVGGAAGCIVGFVGEEVPQWIHKFSKSHSLLGGVLFWLFCLLWLAGIAAFAYAGFAFIRHMRHHV